MRIFDTLMFDGELDLLRHRLAETHDLIDAWVLVEAAHTYRGSSKELSFEKHRESFAWALPKLRHVKLASLGYSGLAPRARSAIQRDAVMLALRDLRPDDIVLLLDADEIPSASLLHRLRREGLTEARRLSMTRHYQYLETIGPHSPCCPDPAEPFATASPRVQPGQWDHLDSRWFGHSGVAVPGRALLGDPERGTAPRSPFDLRFSETKSVPVADAGRHFSSVDPSAQLDRKLGRVFHAEWASARAMQPTHLSRCRIHSVHHRGWWYAEVPRSPLPEDLARLSARAGLMSRPSPLPPFWRRRLVRSWAWLRLWPGWPEPVVRLVDQRFEKLLPLLIAPLWAADLIRTACASWARRHRSTAAPSNTPPIHY